MKPTRYASRFAPLLLSTLMALSTGNCLITAPMLDEALLGGSLNLSNAADDVQAQDATLLAAAVVAASSGPAVISVSPSNLTFASGGCGPAIDQTVTITNLGAGALVLTTPFTLTGDANYSVALPALTSVGGGGNTTVIVTFNPGGNTSSGTLTITSNAVNSPVSIPISGTDFC
jgi:hypothetical protein